VVKTNTFLVQYIERIPVEDNNISCFDWLLGVTFVNLSTHFLWPQYYLFCFAVSLFTFPLGQLFDKPSFVMVLPSEIENSALPLLVFFS